MEMTRSTQRKTNLLIVFLIGFVLLFEQEKSLRFPGSAEMLSWIRIIELILSGGVLFRVSYRKNSWYIPLVLAVLWIFATSWIRSASVLNSTNSKTVLNIAVLVYLLCPAVSLLAEKKDLKLFLQILTASWTLIHVALCLAGFYAVANGIRIMDYEGKNFIGLEASHALVLWDHHYNTTSINLAVSIMVAVVGAAMAKKKTVSALYLLSVVIMFISQTMTGGRSGEMAILIGFGVCAAGLIQKPLSLRIRKKWLITLLCLLLVIVFALGGLLVIKWTQAGINRVLSHSVSVVPSALAEGEETTPESQGIRERSFFHSDFLTGREEIWREALRTLKKNPRLLLTGTSVPKLMSDLKKTTNIPAVSHLHNEALQILMSTGLFGFALFLVFSFFAIRTSVILFFDVQRPLWERALFLPFLCLFLIELVETVRLTAQPDLNGLVMVFTGAAITVAGKKRKEVAPS